MRSWAVEFPQFVRWIVCRPRHRPEEVTGMTLACSPTTLAISRSPTAAALNLGSRVELATTRKRWVPAGAPVPLGGENTRATEADCCG